MLLWRILWKAEALLLAVLVGCSGTPQVVRVETGAAGATLIHIPRTATVEPVEVTPEEVTEVLERLDFNPLIPWPQPLARSRNRPIPMASQSAWSKGSLRLRIWA